MEKNTQCARAWAIYAEMKATNPDQPHSERLKLAFQQASDEVKGTATPAAKPAAKPATKPAATAPAKPAAKPAAKAKPAAVETDEFDGDDVVEQGFRLSAKGMWHLTRSDDDTNSACAPDGKRITLTGVKSFKMPESNVCPKCKALFETK